MAERHRAALRCIIGLMRPEAPPSADALAEAREGDARSLEDLLPDLHELVLISYLGRREAQRLARVSAA